MFSILCFICVQNGTVVVTDVYQFKGDQNFLFLDVAEFSDGELNVTHQLGTGMTNFQGQLLRTTTFHASILMF